MIKKIIKLKDVATIRTGKLNANAQVENGEYPFFTCGIETRRIDTAAFDCECVIVAGNGSGVGHSKYYNGKFNAYQRTYIITCDRQDINTKYLYYAFQNGFKDYIRRLVQGGVIPFITLPVLENFEIQLPPLAEQQIIVQGLDEITSLKVSLQEELRLREIQYKYYLDKYIGDGSKYGPKCA